MSAKVRSKSFAMAIARAWPPIPTSHHVPWGVAVLFTITLQNQQRNLQDVVKKRVKNGRLLLLRIEISSEVLQKK